MFKTGDQLVCQYNFYKYDVKFTKNEIYTVINSHEFIFTVVEDKNNKKINIGQNTTLFISMNKYRKIKIDKIIKKMRND